MTIAREQTESGHRGRRKTSKGWRRKRQQCRRSTQKTSEGQRESQALSLPPPPLRGTIPATFAKYSDQNQWDQGTIKATFRGAMAPGRMIRVDTQDRSPCRGDQTSVLLFRSSFAVAAEGKESKRTTAWCAM